MTGLDAEALRRHVEAALPPGARGGLIAVASTDGTAELRGVVRVGDGQGWALDAGGTVRRVPATDPLAKRAARAEGGVFVAFTWK